MSEKRFKIYQDSIRKIESNRIWGVKSETNSLEPYMTFKEAEKCCDLLNKQQVIINKFREKELYVQDTLRFYYSQIEQKKQKIQILERKKKLLEEENDILKQKMRKNYIANKQYEEMKRLQKENEQLKEEIDELRQKEEVLNKIWRTYLENHK